MTVCSRACQVVFESLRFNRGLILSESKSGTKEISEDCSKSAFMILGATGLGFSTVEYLCLYCYFFFSDTNLFRPFFLSKYSIEVHA